MLRDFMLNPPHVQQVIDAPGVQPEEGAAANQAAGTTKRAAHTPQKAEPQVFSKALWVGW